MHKNKKQSAIFVYAKAKCIKHHNKNAITCRATVKKVRAIRALPDIRHISTSFGYNENLHFGNKVLEAGMSRKSPA